MESIRPVFVNLTSSVTYSEVHNYLNKFGKVSNFDDGKTLSLPGCIIFGDVRKIYPPVTLVNGKFNCVFMMEQANHLSMPHEEFRVLLQLTSPGPLAGLDVGSFLAVYNPRPYVVAKMRSFSSGPEGVVVWYSKAPVPISKLKVVNNLIAPVSTASSMKSIEVRSIKKSFIPVSHSQPVATTSAHRLEDSEDSFNMPPPPSWIDMRRNQRLVGPSVAHGDLKTSHVTARDGSSSNSSDCLKRPQSHHSTRSHNSKFSHHPSCSHHASCSHHSEHYCLPNRTDRHYCSPQEHQGCYSVSYQPQVSCCSHREPPNCHDSLHHSCGCGFFSCSRSHGSCHHPAAGSCGGGCRHHSCSSKSSKCCTRSLCGTNCKEKADDQCRNKSCKKTFSTSQEGSQWFIKEWVEHSKSRIGGEKPRFPGDSQDIDSQPLTGRATYGGSVVDEVLSDDDNFTSISQVLPTADPAPGPSTLRSQQRCKVVISSSDSDSDSSLSDTSTLFLKRNKTYTSTRVSSALTDVKRPGFQAGSIVSSDEMEDSLDVRQDLVAGKLPSLNVQQDHETNKVSNQIEPPSDGHINSETALTDDTQKTCSQEFSVPLILPSKRRGCKSSSDSEDSPAKTKKKRKLFNPSDSSWYFNSARRDPDVPSRDKQDRREKPCEQSDENSTAVEESSGVKDVIKDSLDTEVINTAKDEKRDRRAVEMSSQESVCIIPSSDVEIELRNNGKECKKHIFSANFHGDKSSREAKSKTSSVGGLPPDELVENIIKEWDSDNNSPSSLVPVSVTAYDIYNNSSSNLVPVPITAYDILRDLTDGDHPIIKDNAGAGPVVESNPNECQDECSEKAAELQTRPQLNEESGNCNDVPLVRDNPSPQCANHRPSAIEPNLTKQFSPDDSIFTNETLLDAEMSLSLCEPWKQTSNVTHAEHRLSNRTSPTLSESHQDVNIQTPAVGSENKSPSAVPEFSSLSVTTSNVAEQNSNDRSRISETENSSAEVGPNPVEVSVTAHAAEGRPNLLKEGLRHRSQTLNEPRERTSNVTNPDHVLSNRMSPTLGESHEDINFQTFAVHSEKKNPSALIICQYLSELCDSLPGSTSNFAELNNNGGNQISETENSSVEVGPISIDNPEAVHIVEGSPDAELCQTLCEPQERTSNVTNAAHRISSRMSLTLGDSHQDVNFQTPAVGLEKTNPSALSELCESLSVNTSNFAEPNSNDRNRISETENSSAELGRISIEIHPVEGSPHLLKEGLRHHSPDSTTDGLSEELRQEEHAMRVSPASTVFYDAESDGPSVENRVEKRKERNMNLNKRKAVAEKARTEEAKQYQTSNSDDQDISERVSVPNQIFGVEGAIVDIAPHINEDTMTSIVKGVCRRRCNSRFGHDSVLELPTISRLCKACASRTHHACPCCQNSGFQKPLCFEFTFEIHVLIGEKILRLQVERQEAVKFLGIRAKQFVRKGRHALEILERLQSLCCTDPEEKTHRLMGQLYVKTEQRLDKIVPLLVSTRLKDFKMSKQPL